jgi:hypothetical protein
MAPEQIQGKPLDQATDIYQLGVIIFELLTGQVPFSDSTDFAILQKHLNDPVPSLKGLNPSLPQSCQGVIDKAMGKEKHSRYSSVRDLFNDLEQALKQGMPKVQSPPIAPTIALPQRQGGRIAKLTTVISSVVKQKIKEMDDSQLIVLGISLVIGFLVITLWAADVIRREALWLWIFGGAFYYIGGTSAFAISRRIDAIFYVHIPVHVIVLSIAYLDFMDFNLFFRIIASGLISALSMALILSFLKRDMVAHIGTSNVNSNQDFQFRVATYYIATIIISYYLVIAFFLDKFTTPYISFLGAFLTGVFAYIIDEICTGIQKSP